MFGMVNNTWLSNRCCAGTSMVGRIFIFDHNRGRKPGICNWNEVYGLYEKGEGADYSRLTNINYLTHQSSGQPGLSRFGRLLENRNFMILIKSVEARLPLTSIVG